MVKMVFAALLLLFLAAPVMAQDEFPRVDIAMGYGNIGLPLIGGGAERHSGFAMHSGFNLTRWFGIENFTGAYGLGNGVSLITNIFGAKLAARNGGRLTPYGVTGLGVGYFTDDSGYGTTNMMARLGGGVDVPLNDGMAVKFDFSRMSFHSDGWQGAWHFSTGIVFNLGY